MTTTVAPPGTGTMTAARQAALPPEKLLHSGNAGLIIYRVGQLHYEFAAEGRGFSVDLLNYLNEHQAGVATTFCYEEVFGTRDRMHWLIHMRSPEEYRKLLEMVDHDKQFQDISTVDRLPEKGHGNWEKIFVDGSMYERVLVPQHGLLQSHDEDDESDLDGDPFVPPARNQTVQPFGVQLNSATAGALIVRSARVKYEFREEGRLFAFDWQEYVNRAMAGAATVLLYEETWGRQDRIYWLIHLRELTDYRTLADLDRSPEMEQQIFRKQRVHDSKGGGTWEQLFLPATIQDRLLLPAAPSDPATAS